MEKYLVWLVYLLLLTFVIKCLIYGVRYVAAQDLLWFCRHQVDRFPIESVYLLTKKDVETFSFMFSARVSTGHDQIAIRNEIVKLKGPRGDILKKAYDYGVYRC